jgi:hypothetical protein
MSLGDMQNIIAGRPAGSPAPEFPHHDPKLGDANNARRKADWDRAQLVVHPGHEMMLCGRNLTLDMCKAPGCQYEGDVLCDFPMGRGKTCDLELCSDHACNIGDGLDLCPIHFAIWVEKNRVKRINAWPPKLKKGKGNP